MGPSTVERRSIVAAPADRVWQRVVTPEGINDEMRPIMTMSMPRGLDGMTIDEIPLGTPIGRAWLRLFGVVPFDFDHLTIVDVQPGRAFHEESTMLSMRLWRHERTVTSDGEQASVVHDRITFQPRLILRLAAPILAAGIGAFFSHRHRRLQRHFAASG